MIESAPYWWVECDATGCDNRCPGPEYEHTAWAELSGAVASAEESDWRRDPAGKWFCDEHPRCEDCSEPIDDPALAWVEGVAYHRACCPVFATGGVIEGPATPIPLTDPHVARDEFYRKAALGPGCGLSTGEFQRAEQDCPCPNPNHGTHQGEPVNELIPELRDKYATSQDYARSRYGASDGHQAGCDRAHDAPPCRCRCGKPVSDPAPSCQWHEARA